MYYQSGGALCWQLASVTLVTFTVILKASLVDTCSGADLRVQNDSVNTITGSISMFYDRLVVLVWAPLPTLCLEKKQGQRQGLRPQDTVLTVCPTALRTTSFPGLVLKLSTFPSVAQSGVNTAPWRVVAVSGAIKRLLSVYSLKS